MNAVSTSRQPHLCLQLLLYFFLVCCPVTASHAAETYTTQTLAIKGPAWKIHLPQGMQLETLATGLDGPRLMTFLPTGELLIGSKSGKVYRLVAPYNRPRVLVELDDYPHSVAYRDGELLIAQTDGLYRAPYSPGQSVIDPDEVDLVTALPEGGDHSSRTVAIGPDGRVYVSLGISGNCPDEYLGDSYRFDDRRGGVFVLDESGARPQLVPFAAGLRNPVGFAWHPGTGELYASNNGPDHLGFEQPPEYFSRLLPGSFHGMPWFQFDGRRVNRDTCLRRTPPRPIGEVTIPVATFPARNAPMGVTFVPEGALDGRFAGNAIVALRGSWGTKPSGSMFGRKATRRAPKLVMVEFTDGKPDGTVVDLVTGFQRTEGERLLRPVGVAIGPDGALYFTSDAHLQGLFRLSPSSEKRNRTAPPVQQK
jgi:glucose/arabinose dehydrogenase